MNLKLIFTHFLLINAYTNIEKNMIIDYFIYKKVPTIVGFSCDTDDVNLMLLKNLSRMGVTSVLSKYNSLPKIHMLGKTNYWRLGIFLDLRCYDLQNFSTFSDATDNRMFDSLRHWLIIGSDLEGVLSIIDRKAFGLSTDFVIAVPYDHINNDRYELYDIYDFSKKYNDTLKISFLGSWSTVKGLNIDLKKSKFERRSNLNGHWLRAVVIQSAQKPKDVRLEEYLNDYAHATTDGNAKYGFHVLQYLADLYNFSLEFFESDSWKPNDRYGPLVRPLMNGSADFTASALTMSVPRSYWVKFVHQGWLYRTCFIFRNPQPKNIKVDEIIRPFTSEVWYWFSLFIIILLLMSALVLHYEEFNDGIMKFSNSFIVVVGALCQQGTAVKMENVPTRIVFLFTLIFSLILYNYYSASVVSARLDEPIYKINDSLNQFAKLKLQMASEYLTSLEYFLKQPDWDTKVFYENYWLKLPESQRYMKPEEGMPLVKKGGFAYHTHPDVVYPYIDKNFDHREICELMEVHVARPIKAAISIGINSSIVEIARVGLAKVVEVGLTRRQVLRWTFTKPVCRKEILNVSSLNFYEFAPNLILLAIGMLISLVILAVELIFANFKKFPKFKFLRCEKLF